MINSGDKGKRFERYVRDIFSNALGCGARRGQQYCGSPDSPDVIIDALPGVHVECKHVNRLSIYKAMNQAIADAGDKTPIVVHKTDRQAILVTVRFVDLLRLAEQLHVAMGEPDVSASVGESPLA